MSTNSPQPQNLLLLAGLGIGAYWLMTRHARAGQRPTPAQIPSTSGVANPYRGVMAGLSNAVSSLFGGGSDGLNGTADGRSAQPWDVTPLGSDGPRFNNPSAYVSSALDGAAYNPPASAAYDAAYDSIAGSTFNDNPFAAMGL